MSATPKKPDDDIERLKDALRNLADHVELLFEPVSQQPKPKTRVIKAAPASGVKEIPVTQAGQIGYTPPAPPSPPIPSTIQELLAYLANGIRARPYTRYEPVALVGDSGITTNGNNYTLPNTSDYILIVPKVAAKIGINSPAKPTTPTTPANGAVGGAIAAKTVYFIPDPSVPVTSLPAEIDIIYMNY